MNLLDRLERKFGKFAIKRLPMYIVILNLFVYMLNLLDSRYINYLYLIPSRVLKGEIWRLVTYFHSAYDFNGRCFVAVFCYIFLLYHGNRTGE